MKSIHSIYSYYLGIMVFFTACHLHSTKPLAPAPVEKPPANSPPANVAAATPAPLPVKPAEPALTPLAEAPLIIEAEDGVFDGTIDHHCCWRSIMLSNAQHSTHSGRGAADTENAIGSYLQVTFDAVSDGPHLLTIRYVHPKNDPRPAELRVNNAIVSSALQFPSTAAWTEWRTIDTTLNLKAGRNVFRFTALNAGGLVNIDYLKVQDLKEIKANDTPYIQLLEAEDGEFSGKVESHSCWQSIALTKGHHSGFTGTGFVDAKNQVGSSIEVAIDAKEAGAYSLSIRYVHVKKDDRSAEIRVNDTITAPRLAFPQTGAWTAWQTVSTPIELKKGKNLIRISALQAGGLANIDHFEIIPRK